jgi:hypothetical protein
MTDQPYNALLLVLCKGANGSRVAVQLDSFLEFNARMDHDLKNLVDRWADYQTSDSRRHPPRNVRRW